MWGGYDFRTDRVRMSGIDMGWAGVNEWDNRCRPGQKRKERSGLMMDRWANRSWQREEQIQRDRGTANVWGQGESKGRGTTKTKSDKSTSSKTHPSLSVISLPAFLWCGHHSDEMHPDTGLDVSNLWAFSLPRKWTTVHSGCELRIAEALFKKKLYRPWRDISPKN